MMIIKSNEKVGVKDTTAYVISRQIMDHIYGDDEEMSNQDFVSLYHDFHRRGGSWQALMDGDMRSVKVIEDALECLVKSRGMGQIAARIASKPIGPVG
jgi:hypothetical protein